MTRPLLAGAPRLVWDPVIVGRVGRVGRVEVASRLRTMARLARSLILLRKPHWVAPHEPWDDLIVFIFDGGVLTEQQISTLRPVDNELAAFEFCDKEQAARRLRPYVWHRTQAALDALITGATQYLNGGTTARA